ncbi:MULTISPECIES: hypothetical protein [unclassified Moraxella]|uniref:hypothetical protein n=1 Tax=unclassified Moraxella TaxID=2685852 RepID=UPI003AF927C2
MKRFIPKIFISIFLANIGLALPMMAQADVNMADIQDFATRMSVAANSKSIQQVSKLVADDALVSVSRKGKTSTLNKTSYLNLLQNNWSKASNYNYQVEINNVVVAGNQAKADVVTIEMLTEQGQAISLVTTSRATFKQESTGVVLTRAISQLAIEQH